MQEPIVGMSGKMGDKVFFTRNGQIFCRKAGKRQTKVKPSEIVRRERFGVAARATNAIMNDPILREYWEKMFLAQRKYKSLRGYIFALMYEKHEADAPRTGQRKTDRQSAE